MPYETYISDKDFIKNTERLRKSLKEEYIALFYANSNEFVCSIQVHKSIVMWTLLDKRNGSFDWTTYDRVVYINDDDCIRALEEIRSTHLKVTESKRLLLLGTVYNDGQAIEIEEEFSIDEIIHIIKNSMLSIYCEEEDE